MASCLFKASWTNTFKFFSNWKKKSFKWGFIFLFLQWSSSEHRYVLYCFSFYFSDLPSSDMIFLYSLCCLSLCAACCYRLITNPLKIHFPHQQTCHLTSLPLSYRKPLPLTLGNNTGRNTSHTSGGITPYWQWKKCGEKIHSSITYMFLYQTAKTGISWYLRDSCNSNKQKKNQSRDLKTAKK